MRILLITNDYPPKSGGIQQYLGNIVAGLDENLLVLAPFEDRAEPDPTVERSRRSFMWPTVPVRRWIGRQVQCFQPDVIVFGAPYPLAWLARSLAIPYVVMTHGAEALIPLEVPGVARLMKASLRGADQVVAVSNFTARQIETRVGRPVSTLSAGVDLDVFSPAHEIAAGPMVIGCVSRLVPRKGHAKVVAAADILFRSGVECEVLIVGSGRLEGALRRQAARVAVPVRFETEVTSERLPGLYREMSIFVMPATSRWAGREVEGLGMVYLEAAASGLPVITGPSGGAPETIKVGETGFVASSVGEIADRLAWFADDWQRVIDFGAASRRLAEDAWSWDGVITRFRRVLHDAVGSAVE